MSGSRQDGSQKRLSDGWLLLIALTLILAGGVRLLAWRPRDPRLPVTDVRKAVIAEFARGDGQPVRCKRFEHIDGSLTLDDVDYVCEVGDGEVTVWVGSDAKRITGLASSWP